MDRQAPSKLFLPVAVLVAIFAVSTSSIFIRFAQNESTPSIVIAALRVTLATFLLFPMVIIKHRGDLFHIPRRDIFFVILAGVFLALHFATWITSLEYTSLASSVVLVSTGPLWVALFSPIFLNEKLNRSALIGLGLALAGGLIIGVAGLCTWNGEIVCGSYGTANEFKFTAWGNLLALAGAWTLSGYLIVGRKLRSSVPLIPYIFGVYGTASIFLIILSFLLGSSLFEISMKGFGWIALVAIVPQLIGHSIYNYTLKYLPASVVAVTTLGEPVGSTILAFIIFRDYPGLTTILGGTLILAGIYLAAKQS